MIPTQTNEIQEVRKRPTCALWLTLAGAMIVIGLLAFVANRPAVVRGNFPRRFSDSEKREICSLVRADAYRQSFKSLAHLQFKWAWRWTRYAQRQKVWAIGNQPDGQIWVHLGIADKSQPDGYSLSVRYFMKKESGHWKITAMF